MPVINTRKNNSSSNEYPDAYPADTYQVQVKNVEEVDNPFEKNETQVKFTFAVSKLTDEQEEDGLFVGKYFWYYAAPLTGTRQNGQPTKLQKVIDVLIEGGQLGEDYDSSELDTDDLIGKELRVTVSKYEKDGTERNKVESLLPIRKRRPAPVAAEPAPAKRNRPTAVKPDDVRRAPVATDVGVEDDELFS